MEELDRQFNTEECTSLAPSEVGGSICLSSDCTSPTPTSLGGKSQEEIETEIAKKLAEVLFNKFVVWKKNKKEHIDTEE